MSSEESCENQDSVHQKERKMELRKRLYTYIDIPASDRGYRGLRWRGKSGDSAWRRRRKSVVVWIIQRIDSQALVEHRTGSRWPHLKVTAVQYYGYIVQ